MMRALTILVFLLASAPALAQTVLPGVPTYPNAVTPRGPKGDQGCSIIMTTGEPSPAAGRDCDFALDAAKGKWWGPKIAGSWGAGIVMSPIVAAQTYAAEARFHRDRASASASDAAVSASSASASAADAAASAAVIAGFAAPHVATNAILASTAIATYPNGVWRDKHSVGINSGQLWFTGMTGSCAANGLVVGDGSCVEAPGGNSWRAWPSSPEFAVLQWGADATNTVDMCASIMPAIISAIPSSGGTIVFPDNGSFKCGAQIAVANKSIGFVGLGAGAHINFTSDVQGHAGISIAESATKWVRIENIALHTTVDQVHGNPCISVSYNEVYQKAVTITRFQCIGESAGSRDHYWSDGVVLENVSSAEISNGVITGKNDCADSGCVAASNMRAGIVLSGVSTSNDVRKNDIYFSQYGVYITGKSERSYFWANDLVNTTYGWYLDDDSSGDPWSKGIEAGPAIIGNHCAGYVSCVVLKGRSDSQVIGNVFYRKVHANVAFTAVDIQDGTFDTCNDPTIIPPVTPCPTTIGATKGIFSGNELNLAGKLGSGPNAADTTLSTAFRLAPLSQQNKISGNVATNLKTFLDAGNGTLYNSVTGNSWIGATTPDNNWVINPNPMNDVSGNVPPDVQVRYLETNSATPSVGGKNSASFVALNTAPTTITSFVGGKGGQLIAVAIADSNTTFAHSSSLILRDSADVKADDGDVFFFFRNNNADQWREISRSKASTAVKFVTKCTMTAGTCGALSYGASYLSALTCSWGWTGTGTLNGKVRVIPGTTSVTVNSTDGGDTAQVSVICGG